MKSEVVEQQQVPSIPKKGSYPPPKTPNENVPMNPPPVPARTTVNVRILFVTIIYFIY